MLAKHRKKTEPSYTKDARTVIFTKNQFEAFVDEHLESKAAVHSHSLKGNTLYAVAINHYYKLEMLQFILENRERFPLTEFQVKSYTGEEHTKQDLVTTNKSFVDPLDERMINSILGYNCYITDYDTKAPTGMKVIIWKELALKEQYDAWTEDDRVKYIKEKSNEDFSSYISREVLTLYLEKFDDENILEQKDLPNNSVKLLWRAIKTKKRYQKWLKSKVGKIPRLIYIDSWDLGPELKSFKGKYFTESIIGYGGKEIQFWYKDEEWQKFKNAIREKQQRHLEVSPEEFVILQKHLPNEIQTTEGIKKKDVINLYNLDDDILDVLEARVKKSREFKPSGLEALSDEALRRKSDQDTPIPIALYCPNVNVDVANYEQFKKLILEVFESDEITISQVDIFQRFFNRMDDYYITQKVALERSRRKGKKREKKCTDCGLPKLMVEEQSICNNCRAMNERQHKKDVAAASSGAGAR